MLRKLTAAAAVLFCVAGIGLAATAAPAQAKSVLATHGGYSGADQDDRTISFTFSGHLLESFKVGHRLIADPHNHNSAHVSHAAWPETCSHDGWCYRGHFQSNNSVVGQWRTRGSVWHAWEAKAYSF